MRIISKFHDYYDAAQGLGQDMSRVYLRATVRLESASRADAAAGPLKPFVADRVHTCPSSIRFRSYQRELYVANFGVALFAGKVYPFAKLGIDLLRQPAPSSRSVTFCYSYAELSAAMGLKGFDLSSHKERRGSWVQLPKWAFIETNLGEFFGQSGSEKYMSVALQHGLLVAAYDNETDVLEVSPCLAALQFFREFDAWQAFQELSMFLGNVAAPEKATAPIAEKYRIAQHGFDKWSFKKRPD